LLAIAVSTRRLGDEEYGEEDQNQSKRRRHTQSPAPATRSGRHLPSHYVAQSTAHRNGDVEQCKHVRAHFLQRDKSKTPSGDRLSEIRLIHHASRQLRMRTNLVVQVCDDSRGDCDIASLTDTNKRACCKQLTKVLAGDNQCVRRQAKRCGQQE
jgi:hypothetical protein